MTKCGSPVVTLATLLIALAGCGTQPKQDQKFFTSGNHEADQRADQRMAKAQQVQGAGTGTKADSTSDTTASKSLYLRLGGEAGLRSIIVDFIPRALDDPRINWQRKDVIYGGFSIHHNRSMYWEAKPDKIATLEEHMLQFLALATGGPSNYQGKTMGEAHTSLHISNAEFDASVGDLKASLDKLAIAVNEQKELLSIVESTRPEIVEER